MIRVTASSLWASGFCLLDLILQARAALHSFMKVSSSKHAIAALRQLGKLSERSPRAPTPALAFMAARFLFGVWGRKPPAGFRPLMLSLLTSLMMDSRLITSTRALRSTMLGPVAAAPLFLALEDIGSSGRSPWPQLSDSVLRSPTSRSPTGHLGPTQHISRRTAGPRCRCSQHSSAPAQACR